MMTDHPDGAACLQDCEAPAQTQMPQQSDRSPAVAELIVAMQEIDDLREALRISDEILGGARWLIDRQKWNLWTLSLVLTLESVLLVGLALWVAIR